MKILVIGDIHGRNVWKSFADIQLLLNANNVNIPEYDKYIFKTPESYDELKKEGRELHHCVATYIDAIIDGRTKVILMRKKDNPEKPYYTIELQDQDVIQVRTEYNKSDNDIASIVKEWVKCYDPA